MFLTWIPAALAGATVLESPAPTDWSLFGHAIEGVDINGDGLDDVVVGAANEGDVGMIHVFLGAPGGPRHLAGLRPGDAQSADYFGYALASGDFDGDGFGDVAVGAPGAAEGAGRVFVYLGSPDGVALCWTIEGHGIGRTLAGGGDVDGDGDDELLVGRHADQAVDVHLGGDAGFTRVVEIQGAGGTGWALDGAGDVDGDGFDDLVIGAYTANSWQGQATVYMGDADAAFDRSVDLSSSRGGASAGAWRGSAT